MAVASSSRSLPEVSRDTRVVASRALVSAELEGETVLLSMSEGVYYGLNRVGTFIWRRLAVPVTLEALLTDVVAEFEVTEDRAWGDLVALTQELLAQGLVVRADVARD